MTSSWLSCAEILGSRVTPNSLSAQPIHREVLRSYFQNPLVTAILQSFYYPCDLWPFGLSLVSRQYPLQPICPFAQPLQHLAQCRDEARAPRLYVTKAGLPGEPQPVSEKTHTLKWPEDWDKQFTEEKWKWPMRFKILFNFTRDWTLENQWAICIRVLKTNV